MVHLGVDVGEKRIGVALSDDLEILASPLGLVLRRSTEQALTEIVRLAQQHSAEVVVVGLPASDPQRLSEQARRIRRFGERLRARLSVPLVFADETHSTLRAAEALRAAGVRPEKMRQRLDAAAAAIMLNDYLEGKRQATSQAPDARSPSDQDE
jgi:putative pre-16S rRNA nuclease